MQRFSSEEYRKFLAAYYKNAYPHLRFGQAFLHHFKDKGLSLVTDAELFYTTDMRTATRIIHERYLMR